MFEYISADIKRFRDGKFSFRSLMRGLLSQGFQAIIVYRFFRWLKVHKIPAQPFRFRIERSIEIATGISIPIDCKIGKGLRVHHFGGIIFHPSVELGENCTIYHEVTIGDRGGFGKAAKIGDNVMIGAGAKIIGEILIGNNCIIGANTVVAKDLSDNSVALGNPCLIKRTISTTEDSECDPPLKK